MSGRVYDSPMEARADARAALDACFPALQRLGLQISDRPHACGYQGCVYPVIGTERVLKVTIDPGELEFAAWLSRQHGVPKMLPRIDAAYDLGCYKGLGAILREDLRDAPIRGVEADQVDEVRHFVGGALSLEAEADEFPELYDEAEKKILSLVKIERGRMPAGDDAVEAARRNAANALILIRWTRANGIAIGDVVKRPNWGWREASKELVVRDLGFADGKAAEPAMLSGLRWGRARRLVRPPTGKRR